ncbi:MAG: hypothetical protein IH948_03715 [Bacteroidetes bacterium]|nr:hypothetical protein [Bacteroidota bacterium]
MNELPRGRAVEVSNGVCDANGLVSDLEGPFGHSGSIPLTIQTARCLSLSSVID